MGGDRRFADGALAGAAAGLWTVPAHRLRGGVGLKVLQACARLRDQLQPLPGSGGACCRLSVRVGPGEPRRCAMAEFSVDRYARHEVLRCHPLRHLPTRRPCGSSWPSPSPSPSPSSTPWCRPESAAGEPGPPLAPPQVVGLLGGAATLVMATSVLAAGRLGDSVGLKRLLMLGLVLVTVADLLSVARLWVPAGDALSGRGWV